MFWREPIRIGQSECSRRLLGSHGLKRTGNLLSKHIECRGSVIDDSRAQLEGAKVLAGTWFFCEPARWLKLPLNRLPSAYNVLTFWENRFLQGQLQPRTLLLKSQTTQA